MARQMLLWGLRTSQKLIMALLELIGELLYLHVLHYVNLKEDHPGNNMTLCLTPFNLSRLYINNYSLRMPLCPIIKSDVIYVRSLSNFDSQFIFMAKQYFAFSWRHETFAWRSRITRKKAIEKELEKMFS